MSTTHPHGKICYLELPAVNIGQSADFYARVFGWRMRTRDNGAVAFDDASDQVSGGFVSGRSAAAAPGLLVYIMVDDVAATCEAVAALGGAIVQPAGAERSAVIARFRDPAGNILGLYQDPG
ncbi:MAG TPA: VOC family protein [Steroidobacteraceae bacterium]|nr:VOC family protein [Steroidobacteraceae bacterium]